MPDATVTGLVGLVNQFQFLNPAVNAAVAQANGTEAATAVEDATNDATRARADELPAEQHRRTNTTRDHRAANGTSANLPATENVLRAAARERGSACRTGTSSGASRFATQPQPQAPDAAEVANAIAVRGGLPNIPLPSAPIVVNLTAIPPVPVDLSKAEPTVNATR